ncbi:hypothetical protein TEA_006831 [Camellia sinensis var. sinensis]|uniref:ER membrane protein complex subunit 2 n=1 Tax=Camellia sinensis var. sinensis TaxID=542762 RepID=A0A4S4ELE2_CAMSN|nr:hypothetical protein TEA_006831 [Camellia sinensis var. sinensis]
MCGATILEGLGCKSQQRHIMMKRSLELKIVIFGIQSVEHEVDAIYTMNSYAMQDCIKVLQKKFPESKRVVTLATVVALLQNGVEDQQVVNHFGKSWWFPMWLKITGEGLGESRRAVEDLGLRDCEDQMKNPDQEVPKHEKCDVYLTENSEGSCLVLVRSSIVMMWIGCMDQECMYYNNDLKWDFLQDRVEPFKSIAQPVLSFGNLDRISYPCDDCRLEAMLLEAKGLWAEAEKAYSSLLEDNPLDQVIHKRRAAMAKAQGNLSGAIEWLNKYLEIFMADHDAWRELAEIYVSLQMYKQASFCYEELILSQPTNPLYHLAYADVLYTLSGLENLQTAKKYYASAIDLTGGKNTRALYGCTFGIGQLTKGRNKDDKEKSELQSLAVTALEKDYKHTAPGKLSLLSSTLRSLKLSS